MSAQNDAAFLRMFLLVLGALIAFTVIIIVAANRITGSVEQARGEDPRAGALVAERIKPVGSVKVAGQAAPAPAESKAPAEQPAAAQPAAEPAAEPQPAALAEAAAEAAQVVVDKVEEVATAAESALASVAAPAAPDLDKGKAVYSTACFACHMTGAAGAPKLDDKAAWAPRLAQGRDALVASSINGKGAMPPKGGRVDLADADIEAAVAYMLSQVE